MTRAFLDANVYFAGFHSSAGASALILELGHRQKLSLVSSKIVLREADRNLRKKSSPAALRAFHRYLQQTKIRVIPAPDEKTSRPYEALIHPKDLPVLVAAVISKAEFFITLDRGHFMKTELLTKMKGMKIITPGDFLHDHYLKGKI